MIHDDLTRLFERTPQPELSREFSMNLRRRLRARAPQPRRHEWLRTWTARLYWVIAAALLVRYWPPPTMLSSLQIALLTAIAATIVLTLRRAARPGPLARVLRQLWR